MADIPVILGPSDRAIVSVKPGVPVPPPTPPPPPSPPPISGVPTPDSALGKVFRWLGKDGFSPWKILTYPDSHIGGSGQFMTVFTRYSNGAQQVTMHPDGYMVINCNKKSSGLWDGALVGTSQANNGLTVGFGITRAWLRFNPGPGTWQCFWLYDTTGWSADEIDFPEMLENMHPTYHVLGTGGGGGSYSLPADIATKFHEFSIERRASFIEFKIDGIKVGRIDKAQSTKKLAILMDAKVGFAWMGSTGQITPSTPNPNWLHVAAVTHDA